MFEIVDSNEVIFCIQLLINKTMISDHNEYNIMR